MNDELERLQVVERRYLELCAALDNRPGRDYGTPAAAIMMLEKARWMRRLVNVIVVLATVEEPGGPT